MQQPRKYASPESLELLALKFCSYFLLDFSANFGAENYFLRNNPEHAIPKEVQDYFQPYRRHLLVTRKYDIFKKIWKLLSRPGKYDPYKVWLIAGNHESKELHLHEILMVGSWSSKIFFHMKSDPNSYTNLTKLTLDTRESTNSSFLYETEDFLLKDSLKVVLGKTPNLKDLSIFSFCDDDILSEVIAQHCHKLTRLKIALEVLSTPDSRRLTDEGLIDFIEDSKCQLEHLDLVEAESCSLTAESLVRLKKFSSLTSLEIHGNHLSLLEHATRKDHVNLTVTRLRIVQHIFHESIKTILEGVDKVFVNVQDLDVDFSLPGANIWREIDCIHLVNLPHSVRTFSGQVPRHVDKLTKMFPGLKQLTMTEVRGIEHASHKMPQLKHLAIRLTDLRYVETLSELIPKFPNLERLELNAFPSFRYPCEVAIKPLSPLNCEFLFNESYMDHGNDALRSSCSYLY